MQTFLWCVGCCSPWFYFSYIQLWFVPPLTSCSFQFPVTFHSTPKQKSCALFSNFCSLITTQLTAIFPQPCSLGIIIDPDHGCVWGLLVLNSLYNPRRSYVSFLQKKGICSPMDNPSPISIFTSLLLISSFIFMFTFHFCLFYLLTSSNIHFPFTSAPQVKEDLQTIL